MSLLPKTRKDFTQTEYWNSFFQKRGKTSFEWYLYPIQIGMYENTKTYPIR